MNNKPILPSNLQWSKQLDCDGPLKIKQKKWKVQFPNTLSISEPVIDNWNTIIFGTNSGELIWVNSNGEVDRIRSFGEGVVSNAIFDCKGQLLVAISNDSQACNLMALSSNGEILWKCLTHSDFLFEPVLDHSGNILAATGNELIKVDSKGIILWRFECRNISCCPILDLQGNVHFTSRSENGIYVSLNENGETRWKKEVGKSFINPAPVIDRNGNIYMLIATGGSVHSLYSFDSEGKTNWIYTPQGRGIISSPALSDDGCLIMGTTYFKLISLDLSGHMTWEMDLGHITQFTPILDHKGYIYLYTHEKKRKISSNLWNISNQGEIIWKHKMNDAIQWFTFNPDNGLLIKTINPDTYLLELTSYEYN